MAAPPNKSTSPTSMEKRGHFRFLDLPAELRNRIYDYTLGPRKLLYLYDRDPHSIGMHKKRLRLAQTSRQIRLEFLPVLYSQTTFGLRAFSGTSYYTWDGLLNTIGEDATSSLRHLEVTTWRSSSRRSSDWGHYRKYMLAFTNAETPVVWVSEGCRTCDSKKPGLAAVEAVAKSVRRSDGVPQISKEFLLRIYKALIDTT